MPAPIFHQQAADLAQALAGEDDFDRGRWKDVAALLAERLLELETRFAAVLRREKLASLKQLAYGASHEINNPLANISTRAQTLLRDETHPDRRRMLATIHSQAFRAHEMIADMMLFARPPQIVREPVDVASLLNEAAREQAAAAEAQGTTLVSRCETRPLSAPLDRVQIAAAVAGLIRNALEGVQSGGRVEVVAGKDQTGQEPALLRIDVADDGPGLSDEARRHLFDPFYSGREAGRGLGLGLSKCWTIATAHGGTIDAEDLSPQGTRLRLRLPLAPTPASSAAA